MLPLSIFAERQFAATSAVTFIVYAALTGATFVLPLVLQIVSGYSPAGGRTIVGGPELSNRRNRWSAMRPAT